MEAFHGHIKSKRGTSGPPLDHIFDLIFLEAENIFLNMFINNLQEKWSPKSVEIGLKFRILLPMHKATFWPKKDEKKRKFWALQDCLKNEFFQRF